MPRLLLYNIAYGQGCTGRTREYFKIWKRFFTSRSITQITTAIRGVAPDIVGLIEVDKGSRFVKSQFQKMQYDLQAAHGDVVCKYPANASLGFGKIASLLPVLHRQSNGLLSHHKIIDKHHYFFSCGMKRLVSKYVLAINKKRVTLFLVHLALGKKTRLQQIQELSLMTRIVRGPLIIMGDFNASAHELHPLLKEKKQRLAMPAAMHTFPAFKPKRQLDYIITSGQIKVKSAKTYPWQFSDHLPICIDFEIQ